MSTTLHRFINVYLAVERTTTGVVSAIDGIVDGRIITIIIDNGLIHIACHINTWGLADNFQYRISILIQDIVTFSILLNACFHVDASVGTAEDAVATEGGTCGYVDYRTAGDTFLITATIYGI